MIKRSQSAKKYQVSKFGRFGHLISNESIEASKASCCSVGLMFQKYLYVAFDVVPSAVLHIVVLLKFFIVDLSSFFIATFRAIRL